MPTVIPRQYNESVPMWLETLINNISLSPMTSAIPVAEAAGQATLPFAKTVLNAISKGRDRWKMKPLAEMPPQSGLSRAVSPMDNLTQGAFDFGDPVTGQIGKNVPPAEDPLKALMTGRNTGPGQLDLDLGIRGPWKEGPPLADLPPQSPVGKSPFADLFGTQKKLPLKGNMLDVGEGGFSHSAPTVGQLTAKAAPKAPAASPVAEAAAGKLGKSGMLKKAVRYGTLPALGAGYLMMNRGDAAPPAEAVETGSPAPTGGGRRTAPSAPAVDWSSLEQALGGSTPGQPLSQPTPDIGTLLGAVDPKTAAVAQKKDGFDWSQLTQMLPALLVAIAMMKGK